MWDGIEQAILDGQSSPGEGFLTMLKDRLKPYIGFLRSLLQNPIRRGPKVRYCFIERRACQYSSKCWAKNLGFSA
jgi:hypothetical protein